MTTNTPSEQPAIPAGMVRWAGGDSAPGDWDGGPVLFRSRIGKPYLGDWSKKWDWRHGVPETGDGAADIIAYTPAIPASAGGADDHIVDVSNMIVAPRVGGAEATELLGEALFALSAHLKESGFFDRASHHLAYERVVAAFNALPVDQPAQASEVELSLPSDVGVCAYDTDEATITLAFPASVDILALVRKLPSRNRARNFATALAPQSERAEADHG